MSGLQVVTAILDGSQIATLGTAPLQLLSAPPNAFQRLMQWAVIAFASGVSVYDFSASPLAVGDFPSGNETAGFGTVALDGTDPVEQQNVAHPVPVVLPTPREPMTFYASALADPARTSGLATLAVVAGGLGYAMGDLGTVDANGAGGRYQVTAVGALGVVTGVAVFQPGAGYDTVNNPHATTAQTGIGAGLTVDVTAIQPPDGQLFLTVAYLPQRVA